MDELKRKRAIQSIQEEFNPVYDPTEDLPPELASKVKMAPSYKRSEVADQAFDEAGAYAQLKRMLKGAFKGKDKYKN